MLNIIHILLALLVGCLLLTPVVLPFWKVWRRLKSHHPDIWHAKGPFDIVTMLAYGNVVKNFFEIIALAEHDEELKARDPYLVKWAHTAREMIRMLPQGMFKQVLAAMIFMALVYALSGQILAMFGA